MARRLRRATDLPRARRVAASGPRDLAHLSDEAVVALIARAEEPALAELYDRYGGAAYALARRILRDPSLAEDAVHEAFLSIWRGASRFLPERARAAMFGENAKPVPLATKEEARAYFTAEIERQRRALEAGTFCTHPRSWIIDHAEHALRWIDCAPEGARWRLAPMQDKLGVPCGAAMSENVGVGGHLLRVLLERGKTVAEVQRFHASIGTRLAA